MAETIIDRAEALKKEIDSLMGAEMAEIDESYSNVFLALSSLPEEIGAIRLDIKDIRADLNEAKDELEQEKASLFMEVNAAVDDRGKKKYTNNEMRQAALQEGLRINDYYQEVVERARDIESELANKEVELRILEDKFRANRAMADLLAARMRMLSA